jgi:predicted oxidoreductase
MSATNPTLSFSPLIIGTMRLGEWGVKMTPQQLEHFIEICLDMGLSDFDHADIYGGYTEEAAFGAVLRKRPELRQRMQLTTKCGIKMLSQNRPEHLLKHYDSGKAHIISSVENSLRCLHTDYLDLLLLHRPDFLMDPTEIATAFELLRQEGKVRILVCPILVPAR